MHSAPPVGRGLGAGQKLRSPQEASSSLETKQQGRRGRAGDMGVRHRCALEHFSDFPETRLLSPFGVEHSGERHGDGLDELLAAPAVPDGLA
jgi:hypothetical protein